MVFEKKIEEHNIKIFKPSSKTKVRLDLEPKRENELQKINKVYSKEVYFDEKKIGRTKIIKMDIDNLIADLEKLPEEEAVEYVRTLYKEAEF